MHVFKTRHIFQLTLESNEFEGLIAFALMFEICSSVPGGEFRGHDNEIRTYTRS